MSDPAQAAEPGQTARIAEIRESDVVVVGTGVAGLTAALGAAPRRVDLLTKSRFGSGGSSAWAQGGVAVAVGRDDAPALHAADTMAAGAGLNDPAVVAILTSEGPKRVEALLALGARFDRDPQGQLALGREAAHSRRRILHAHGDATGAEMLLTLSLAVEQAPEVAVCESTFALDLAVVEGEVAGVLARHPDGRLVLHAAPAVVVATGGLGRLFAHTTNPIEATADGLAMAARAGARLLDLEFVQFHPTALASGADPMPLLTEALRGEGAILIDETGYRFMLDEHPDRELAPRDVVARAIWKRIERGSKVFLDARAAVGEGFPERFPTVFALCRREGLDPRREPIPVAPAAHYHMGGIAVDAQGRSSLPGLWACGEVSATGAHGANRLASNSLLEALVFGARVADDLRRPRVARPRRHPKLAEAGSLPAAPPGLGAEVESETITAIRRIMWQQVGLVRDERGLTGALAALDQIASERSGLSGEARNLLCAGRLVAATALARRESRGGHYRSDYPEPDPAWQRHLIATLDEAGEIDIELGPLPQAAPIAAAGSGR
ncbi:MAG TPA: L-aspartate oxidase [Thermoanaerobaculia bacterium]|nr:L-aspartate oxidase [Thermoanaerobaculia bacterium]